MSKLSGQRTPSPIIDLRKENLLTIITEEGVSYQAKVTFSDVDISIERDTYEDISELGWLTRIPTFATTIFQLTARTTGQVTRRVHG